MTCVINSLVQMRLKDGKWRVQSHTLAGTLVLYPHALLQTPTRTHTTYWATWVGWDEPLLFDRSRLTLSLTVLRSAMPDAGLALGVRPWETGCHKA